MADGKTTTITIHHDRCDVFAWAMADWRVLADFVKFPTMQHAAALSRRGMQLVLSEHFEPKGGDMEIAGWAPADDVSHFGEIDEIAEDDLVEVVPVYRGKSQFAVRFTTGDQDGNYEGTEHELFETQQEAADFLKSLRSDDPATEAAAT